MRNATTDRGGELSPRPEQPTSAASDEPITWGRASRTGLGLYLITSALVLLGAAYGQGFGEAPEDRPKDDELSSSMVNWDGGHYHSIASFGYRGGVTEAGYPVSFAFFPAYPGAAGAVAWLTGCSARWALLIVSHLCLAGTFVLLVRYAAERFPQWGMSYAGLVALAFGLFPAAMFMRMGYSESMFTLAAMFVFWGLHRRWPLWLVALFCGWLTATRPVGVAFVLPLMWEVYRRYPTWTARLPVAAAVGALSCWGLIAYMAFQWATVGDPLAFAKVQAHWSMSPPVDWPAKLWALVTLEPLWRWPGYGGVTWWTNWHGCPAFSFQTANMLAVGLTLLAVGYGARKKLLIAHEVLPSLALVLIPYVTKGYENSFHSFGRFMSVVMPAYLVYGRVLMRLPSPWRESVLCFCAFYAAVFAAMFVAGWWVI